MNLVRITKAEMLNVKNVHCGKVKSNSTFDSNTCSGKTAFIEVFSLLKSLLNVF
jgi:hypothetical protein